jgi:DNA-binding MarR family transcriptional regulator
MSSVTQNETTEKHPRLLISLSVLIGQLEQALSAHPGNIGKMSPIEMHILASLGSKDGQAASELARSIGRAATSFTPNIDKLEAAGVICREADPNDRRAIKVFLTPAGREMVSGADEAIAEVEQAFEARIANYLPVRI